MKECKKCNTQFEVTSKDRRFYEMMDAPEPTLCSSCREQRRLSYRNESFLYHRKCDLTGEEMISNYSVDKPFPVYSMDAWWSDRYDPLKFSHDFDFNRPFFEQFFELRNSVPRLTLIQQEPMINSEYCNTAGHNKNCYLCFSASENEDCYYSSWINYCRNCVDCKNINKSELCYECIDCRDCFGLKYSQNCSNCKTSYFLKNCQGCKDCFGCSNLINKQYYIFNKPCSKQAYDKFFEGVDTGSYKIIEKIKEKIDEELNDLIVKEYEGTNNQNSLGNYLRNNKNAYMCFECEDCEDIRYAVALTNAKNSMDHNHWGGGTENVYETQACGYNCANIRFCNLCCSSSSDLTYCDHCFFSKDCFGCVGLKRNKYCIFNKQYSKEEYEKLMLRIIEHMKSTNEWGEFFPANQAPYAYNETLAYEEYPLKKEEVLKRGWKWIDEKEELKQGDSEYKIPDNIKDVDDEILDKVLKSTKSGKLYKIIAQELKFYRENNIPIPRIVFRERHLDRLAKRNPRHLWDRKCDKCQSAIKTTYSPERQEKVYCEQCYLKEVY